MAFKMPILNVINAKIYLWNGPQVLVITGCYCHIKWGRCVPFFWPFFPFPIFVAYCKLWKNWWLTIYWTLCICFWVCPLSVFSFLIKSISSLIWILLLHWNYLQIWLVWWSGANPVQLTSEIRTFDCLVFRQKFVRSILTRSSWTQ